MIDAFSMFTLLGITIFLGYVCSIIFKKTQIPDVIWLLLFGLLIGPVFNLIDRTIFITIAPLLAAFALLMILFDAGLEMNLYNVIKQFPRSILLSIVGISLTIISIAVTSVFLFNFDWIRAFLLGSIIGGPSSAIVVSILKRLNIREDVRIILDLESIFTDPVDVVLTIALIQIYISTLPLNSIIGNIASAFSIGAVLGFTSGIAWLFLLNKIKDNFDYMLTLAILLLIYTFVEYIGGSGAVASLVFGIVLGSGKIFSKALKFKKSFSITPSLKKFHEEITFFVRSFFFVAMGIIVSINSNFIIQGIVITIVIALIRIVAVFLSTYKMKLTPLETNIMRIVIPQGLATAVMAYMPMVYGVKDAEIFLNIAFIVILATIAYTTVAMKILYVRNKPDKKIKPGELQ
jgi:cell volume regulation protein A